MDNELYALMVLRFWCYMRNNKSNWSGLIDARLPVIQHLDNSEHLYNLTSYNYIVFLYEIILIMQQPH